MTILTLDKEQLESRIGKLDKEMKEKIRKLCKGLAQSMGGDCEVTIDEGYPVVDNDADVTEKARQLAIEYLGQENVVELEVRTTAEDFAYYSQVVPGCFYRLGTRNENRGITSNLHTATVEGGEESVKTGRVLTVWLVIKSVEVWKLSLSSSGILL